jgi:hypothetical protein
MPNGKCLDVYIDKFDLTRNGDTISGTKTRTIRTIDDPEGGGGSCSGIQEFPYDIGGSRVSTDTKGCFGSPAPRYESSREISRLFRAF